MATSTTTYSFQKPLVGGDDDDWGTYINANFDSLDNILSGQQGLVKLGVGTSNTSAVLFTVDDDSIQIQQDKTPGANSAGLAGEIAWDASYLYVCVSTNSWKRVPLQNY